MVAIMFELQKLVEAEYPNKKFVIKKGGSTSTKWIEGKKKTTRIYNIRLEKTKLIQAVVIKHYTAHYRPTQKRNRGNDKVYIGQEHTRTITLCETLEEVKKLIE